MPPQCGVDHVTFLKGAVRHGEHFVDRYLQTLLIHGARAVLSHYKDRDNDYTRWVGREKATLSHNKASVALANKNARIIWSMLNTGEEFNYGAQTAAA